MGFLTRADDRFVEKAVDDTRRASAIADMNWRRVVMLCLAMFLAVIVLFMGNAHEGFWVGGAVLLALYMTAVAEVQSELRLLKVIDRLRKEGRDGALEARREVKGEL
jgi:hypothetical protein